MLSGSAASPTLDKLAAPADSAATADSTADSAATATADLAAPNDSTAATKDSAVAKSAPNTSTPARVDSAPTDSTTATSGSVGKEKKKTDSDNADDSEDDGSNDGRDDGDDGDDKCAKANEDESVSQRLAEMEGRISRLEAENLKMRGELRELRDRVEEEEWARGNMESKVEEREKMEKEVTALREEVAKEKKERENREREMEKRISEKLKGWQEGVASNEAINQRNERSHPIRKKRCIVFTDSNGKWISEDMVKIHIPKAERETYDVLPVVAPTIEIAYFMVAKGDVDVRGAVVVIDNLTNDVRGNPNRPAATPQELIRRVDRLRERVRVASAVAVVVCEVKPMQVTDVRPHNSLLDSYLSSKGRTGYGCRTQIRMNTLKPDGFHINPSEYSVLAKTYACAIQGLPVPCPTPVDDFVPLIDRRRYEAEWPRVDSQVGPQGRVSQGQNMNHGWLW